MSGIDLDAFRATPLVREPFEYLIVPHFITPAALPEVQAAYPAIEQAGSFPLSETTYGAAFRGLINELQGPEMRRAFEEKFEIDLSGRPTMITVRGQSDLRDGKIHTDATSKIITVLLYMNSKWEPSGGRLRLLRSGGDLEDVLVEVPPEEGVLLAFRRRDNSWHGHLPFIGPRRVIQLNWVTHNWAARWNQGRHRVSAWVKSGFGLFRMKTSVQARLNRGSLR